MKKLLKKEIKNIKSRLKFFQSNPHNNPLENNDLWDLLFYRKEQLKELKKKQKQK